MPFEEIVEGTQHLQGWGWHKLVTLFDHCKLSTRLRTVPAAQSRVERILVVDNAATGVPLDDGTGLTAPLVISNADYRRTALDLVGAEHFEPELVRDTGEASMGLPFATVYLALDRELDTQPEDANTWWYAGDDIEHLYESPHNDGQPEEIRHLFISFASRKDGDSRHLHPKGHSTAASPA